MNANSSGRHPAASGAGEPTDTAGDVAFGQRTTSSRPRWTRSQRSVVGLVGAVAAVVLAACGMVASQGPILGAMTASHRHSSTVIPAAITSGTSLIPTTTAPPNPTATAAPAASATVPATTPTTAPAPTTTAPAATVTTNPPASTTTAPVDTGYGCADAVAYLQAHADPAYQIICPGDSGPGHEAMTCSNVSGYCLGFNEIVITDPCPAAYMNEASNSWVLDGKSDAPIDPYGDCENPVGVP